MKNSLLITALLFLCYLNKSNAQTDIDFAKFKAKANQAFLLKKYVLARDYFNQAYSINPSCNDCLNKLKEISALIKYRPIVKKNILTTNPTNLVIPSSENTVPRFVAPFLQKITLPIQTEDSLLTTVYFSKTEVSQKEWKVYCSLTKKNFPTLDAKLLNDNFPIVGISWTEAKEYANWVSTQTGEIYDLPTMYEWQNARSSIENIKAKSWIYDNSSRTLHPIATKEIQPNGLYDIEGNAAEWVDDWSDKDFIEDSKLKDLYDDNSFKNRTVCGCSFKDEFFLCQKPFIRNFDSELRKDFIGFRLIKRNF